MNFADRRKQNKQLEETETKEKTETFSVYQNSIGNEDFPSKEKAIEHIKETIKSDFSLTAVKGEEDNPKEKAFKLVDVQLTFEEGEWE